MAKNSEWLDGDSRKKRMAPYPWIWDIRFTKSGLSVFLREIGNPDTIQVLKLTEEEIWEQLKKEQKTRNVFQQVNYEGKMAREIDKILDGLAEAIKKQPLISAGRINPLYETDVARISVLKAWMAIYKNQKYSYVFSN